MGSAVEILRALAANEGYAELLPHTVELALGADLVVKVLELESLIELKQRLGRPKDVAVLPLLKATLEELRRSKGGRP